MQVLKLLAMGLAGYAVYEIGRNLMQASGGMGEGRPSPAQEADIHRQVLSGEGGEGMAVEVHDPSGATRQQVVGRGVISR